MKKELIKTENLEKMYASMRSSIETFTKRLVKTETKDCLRCYRAVVTQAPSTETKLCGIKLTGSTEQLLIPFSSAVSSVNEGDLVWVLCICDSMSNSIVWQKNDFS